jgi:hypothetical protein
MLFCFYKSQSSKISIFTDDGLGIILAIKTEGLILRKNLIGNKKSWSYWYNFKTFFVSASAVFETADTTLNTRILMQNIA